MVHPQLTRGGGSWYAFWGATLDDHIQRSLAEIAAALPLVGAEGFHEDREATVADLYPQLVDQIARDKLVAAGVKLGDVSRIGRRTAVDSFLAGLSSPDPELPQNASYAGLERRLTRWVDSGLAEVQETHVAARSASGRAPARRARARAVAACRRRPDAQPAGRRSSGRPATTRSRSCARAIRSATSSATSPSCGRCSRREGIEFDEEQPFAVELDAETVSYFLRDLMPRLDERGVPVALPSAWLRAPTRLRANLTARSEPFAQSSGLLSTSVLASFDWRLAVGDMELTDEELRALAAAKSPVVQVDGRWQAVRPRTT